MINISNKSECTGCSACYSVCSKNAISMVTDKEGFK
ncbi:MAG: 4Fe-4S binding protein, partial [Paludibacteraceae bacterium]|nr:4Fe-4S binding protein [Paludibacteraceae bacterium]